MKDIPVLDGNGEPEDPFLSSIINQAWQSGNIVIVNDVEAARENFRNNLRSQHKWWKFWGKKWK